MIDESMSRKFIALTVIASLSILILGSVFGYTIHPAQQIEYITIIEEVPVYINTTIIQYESYSVNYYSYLFTDMNESVYSSYWDHFYVETPPVLSTPILPYNYSNDAFLYAITINVGRIDGIYPEMKFILSGAFGFHPNVTIDRIAVLTYHYNASGLIVPYESHNFYNFSHPLLVANFTKTVVYGLFGTCLDLDSIIMWFPLTWFEVKLAGT